MWKRYLVRRKYHLFRFGRSINAGLAGASRVVAAAWYSISSLSRVTKAELAMLLLGLLFALASSSILVFLHKTDPISFSNEANMLRNQLAIIAFFDCEGTLLLSSTFVSYAPNEITVTATVKRDDTKEPITRDEFDALCRFMEIQINRPERSEFEALPLRNVGGEVKWREALTIETWEDYITKVRFTTRSSLPRTITVYY